MPQQTIIVGAGEAGRRLAEKLEREGESVSLIDTDEKLCAAARDLRGVRVLCADATDVPVLRRAGAEDAKCLVALTPSDKLNLLVCQVARAAFGVPRLVGKISNETYRTAFETSGIETISSPNAEATLIEQMLVRPSLFELMNRGSRSEKLAEVTVTSRAAHGKTLADLRMHGSVVIALRRRDSIVVPTGRTRLRTGDLLTLMGSEAALNNARLLLNPPDHVEIGEDSQIR